jgi:hypothetical protein
MENYLDIQKYFGTPINYLSKPNVLFQPKTVHFIIGGIILITSIYGIYMMVQNAGGYYGKTATRKLS